MAGQLRVDEITDEAGTGSPSFPQGIQPNSLGTGTPGAGNFLRGDGVWEATPVETGNTTVRQTVLSGSVNANGRADFLQAGTGLQVVSTTSAPLNITFGDGFVGGKQRNFGVQINAALTWSNLPDNTANVFLFVRVTEAGVVSTFHSLIAPKYDLAAPVSPSNGQTFYPIDHRHRMQERVSGEWVVNDLIICVGQCVTSSGNAVSVVSYAYQGFSESAFLQGQNSTRNVFSHNIGTERNISDLLCRQITASVEGWVAGELQSVSQSNWSTSSGGQGFSIETNSIFNAYLLGSGGMNCIRKDTFSTTGVTNANRWNIKIFVKREF